MRHVVAGILYNAKGEILLSTRPEGKSFSGYWEFAGGKIEHGETEFQALQREFHEELGIHILRATPYLIKENTGIRLRFYRINAHDWQGKPTAKEHQMLSWQNPFAPTVSPMLSANAALLSALTMPRELSGSLNTGLRDPHGHYTISPNPHSHAHIMLPHHALSTFTPPPNHHVWAIINHADHILQAAVHAHALIWRIQNHNDAQSALHALQHGAPLPIAIDAPPELCTLFAEKWQQNGVQAIIKRPSSGSL